MSWFFSITAQTRQFPVMFKMTRMDCTVTTVTWADPGSWYDDITSSFTTIHRLSFPRDLMIKISKLNICPLPLHVINLFWYPGEIVCGATNKILVWSQMTCKLLHDCQHNPHFQSRKTQLKHARNMSGRQASSSIKWQIWIYIFFS